MKKIISVLLCVAAVLQLSACSQVKNNKEATGTITAMNTVMQITVFNTSKGTNEDVLEKMKERIYELSDLFDANLQGSDVYRINNSDGDESKRISVSDDTINVLEAAIGAYHSTDNLFDIKLMPVISLWGFDNGKYGVPKNSELEKAVALVDKSRIYVYETENAVSKTKGTKLSLGGIAKGYLGDELLKIADEYGATALLSLGGNVVLCGDKSENELWSVGIKNPTATDDVALSFKCKGNNSVVTSGGYERFFEYNGKTYHHIIDPETGRPADSDLLSVTVVGENGTLCDAYSTALFVMGKEKAVEFAKENNDFEFVFITDNKEIFLTDGVSEPKNQSDYKIKSIER